MWTGIDIGFSTRRPTAGIGFLVGGQLDLENCFGVDACHQLAQGGPYDMVAIDGPVLPSGQNNENVRNVEKVFCKGPFQRRCKPGMSHVRGTAIRLREEAGKAADILSDTTNRSRVNFLFLRARQGQIIEAFPKRFLVCVWMMTFMQPCPHCGEVKSSSGFIASGRRWGLLGTYTG